MKQTVTDYKEPKEHKKRMSQNRQDNKNKKISHWLRNSIRKCRHWFSPFIVDENDSEWKSNEEPPLSSLIEQMMSLHLTIICKSSTNSFTVIMHSISFSHFLVNWTLWLHTPNNGRKQRVRAMGDERRVTSVEWSIAPSSICDLVENEHKITIKANQSQDQLWLLNHIFSNRFCRFVAKVLGREGKKV